MQMEVMFGSMSEWEDFLSSIPFQEHKAWTQRIQSMVVDGSPKWEVHRSVALLPPSGGSSSTAAAAPIATQKARSQIPPSLYKPNTGSSTFDEEVCQGVRCGKKVA
jgi:hypothetical protein